MKTSFSTFIFILILSFSTNAQSTPEPLYHDVYPFLERMAQKGVIQFNDEIRPLPRKYIFEKLIEVEEKVREFRSLGFRKFRITEMEIEELEFFLRDYNLEINLVNSEQSASGGTVNSDQLSVNSKQQAASDNQQSVQTIYSITQSPNHTSASGGIHPRQAESDPRQYNQTDYSIIPISHDSSGSLFWLKDVLGRYRFFSYSSDLFKVNVDPIFGYDVGKQNGESYSHFWNGARMYGYISNWLGFSFDFRDNSVDSKNGDINLNFTPETGYVISRRKPNHFEYERTNTEISASWSWGRVAIGKTPIVWGYGESGNLVHSTKAPSYPLVRLDLTLAPWLRFNYFHGWLSSDVMDSAASYPTYREGQNRIVLRNKYIASHSIILNPVTGVSVSLGESVIYSDKLEPLFLFPLMFFRAADHYLSNGLGGNNSGANSQFFLGLSSRNNIPNTHLYGTFFIDEVTIGDIFNPKKQRTQYAFQLGASVTDLPIDNLTFTTEFTKIYPFVYRHYIPTQTYENHGFLLGDWMGHNSDRIYGALNYRFIRGLQATIWGEYIRKGGDGVVDDQYIVPQPPFLFGLRKYYTRWGVTAKYEIIHDLFVRLRYNNFLTSEEQTDGSFTDSKVDEFYFAVYYGM